MNQKTHLHQKHQDTTNQDTLYSLLHNLTQIISCILHPTAFGRPAGCFLCLLAGSEETELCTVSNRQGSQRDISPQANVWYASRSHISATSSQGYPCAQTIGSLVSTDDGAAVQIPAIKVYLSMTCADSTWQQYRGLFNKLCRLSLVGAVTFVHNQFSDWWQQVPVKGLHERLPERIRKPRVNKYCTSDPVVWDTRRERFLAPKEARDLNKIFGPCSLCGAGTTPCKHQRLLRLKPTPCSDAQHDAIQTRKTA